MDLKSHFFKHEDAALKAELFVDVANNKVYLQTKPYLKEGKLIVKRLAEYEYEIETVKNLVTEYDLKESY